MIVLGGLIPLLILGGIIALIVRLQGQRSADPRESPDTGAAIRRFFHYAVMYGLVILVAIGVAGVLTQILPDGGSLIRRGSDAAARDLSYVIVGGPVLAGLALWGRRRLDEDPSEVDSFTWMVYLSATLITSLLVAGWSAFGVLTWAVGVEPFAPEPLAGMVVWGGVWVVHWLIGERRKPTHGLGLHLFAGSTIGIFALGTALAFGLARVLRSIYVAMFDTSVAGTVADDLGRSAAGLVVGGVVWWWYWLRHGSHLERTILWRGYVLLVGVLGGLVTAVVAAATLVYTILHWFFGDDVAATAAQQFDVSPAAIASAIVGVGVWSYHRTIYRDAAPGRTEVSRVYNAVIAGVGLIAATAGVTTIIVAIIESIVSVERLAGDASAANTLVLAATLLLVGLPLWWVYWIRIQTAVTADPIPEVTSPTRRVYLFTLFGVGGVVALIGLLLVVLNLLEDLIDAQLGADTLRDARVPIALVLTMGAVAGYHLLVYRNDRRFVPASVPVSTTVKDVILLGDVPNEVVELVRNRTGARIRVWHRLDVVAPSPSTPASGAPSTGTTSSVNVEAEPIIEAITSGTAERLLMIISDGGLLEAFPYDVNHR